MVTGIICEYNPLHTGHKKQLDTIRSQFPEGGIVCLMSGNYVQRGMPALVDKSLRAKAAVLCGADLVLELPLTASLSSAEGFAAQGVGILKGFCQQLCFGSETGSKEALMATARALLSSEFSQGLRAQLDTGISFPAARQQALEAMGLDARLLSQPNDILATEYCKAILSQNTQMEPLVILRQGDYHDTCPDLENPSATALRQQMLRQDHWESYVPQAARECFRGAALHTLEAGERAVLARLRSMAEADFAALPYGSEGLWRKLMRAVHQKASLEAIITAVKSKRYTRTRLDRMLLCAFLGLTAEDLASPAPYVRVLALNNRGREILKQARATGCFVNAGEAQENAYQTLETRAGDLYGLFAQNVPEDPGVEAARRVYYQP